MNYSISNGKTITSSLDKNGLHSSVHKFKEQGPTKFNPQYHQKKKKRLKEKKVKINYKSIKELEKVFLLEREDVPKCNKKIQNT
jgi:hypothetical protein